MSTFLDDLLNESPEGTKEIKRAKLRVEVTEKLLLLLQAQGLSKAELATALGVSRSAVSQVLSGSRNMSLNLIADVACALRVEPRVTFTPTAERCAEEASGRADFARIMSADTARPNQRVTLVRSAKEGQFVVLDSNAAATKAHSPGRATA